jgi:hypothetical protein
VLRRVPLGVDRPHYAGLVGREVVVRLAEAEALLKADRFAAVLIEDLRLTLDEDGLEQHLAGMLGMHQDRGDPSGVVVAIERRHCSPKRLDGLGLERSSVAYQLHSAPQVSSP